MKNKCIFTKPTQTFSTINIKFIHLIGFLIGTIFNSCSDNLREEVMINNQVLSTSMLKKVNFAELNCDAQLKANIER